jgi:hypothetical protein
MRINYHPLKEIILSLIVVSLSSCHVPRKDIKPRTLFTKGDYRTDVVENGDSEVVYNYYADKLYKKVVYRNKEYKYKTLHYSSKEFPYQFTNESDVKKWIWDNAYEYYIYRKGGAVTYLFSSGDYNFIISTFKGSIEVFSILAEEEAPLLKLKAKYGLRVVIFKCGIIYSVMGRELINKFDKKNNFSIILYSGSDAEERIPIETCDNPKEIKLMQFWE